MFFKKAGKNLLLGYTQNQYTIADIANIGNIIVLCLVIIYCNLSNNNLAFFTTGANTWGNKCNSVKQISGFIEQEPENDSLEELNENTLMSAAEEGKVELVIKCLAKGVNVNAANFGGWTALMFACDGQPYAIETLLNAGATVNIKNKNGSTPLMLASRRGFTNAVKALVIAGAKLDEKDWDGSTPLLLAARTCNPDTVTYLISAGANVNIANQYGSTPLIEISSCSNCNNLINLLLESGANINAKTVDGRPALTHAAISGEVENVKKLLLAGANVNSVNNQSKTVLEDFLDYSDDEDKKYKYKEIYQILKQAGAK